MDANLGSLDRVYETLAASRRVARLENQATEMVRERTVVPEVTTRTDPSRAERLCPGKAQ